MVAVPPPWKVVKIKCVDLHIVLSSVLGTYKALLLWTLLFPSVRTSRPYNSLKMRGCYNRFPNKEVVFTESFVYPTKMAIIKISAITRAKFCENKVSAMLIFVSWTLPSRGSGLLLLLECGQSHWKKYRKNIKAANWTKSSGLTQEFRDIAFHYLVLRNKFPQT